MKIENIPFNTVNWSQIERVEKTADAGSVFWRTQQFGDPANPIRVRMVEYSPGYVSDHWCTKGHILLCLEGELITVLADGRQFTLQPGMSYQVADHAEPHRSTAPKGAKLFIVD
jgi:quercetin dioxygenase-like cupin family protein